MARIQFDLTDEQVAVLKLIGDHEIRDIHSAAKRIVLDACKRWSPKGSKVKSAPREVIAGINGVGQTDGE
jgi:hypothetical protein